MAAFAPKGPLLAQRSRATRPAHDVMQRSTDDSGEISLMSLKYDNDGEKDVKSPMDGGPIYVPSLGDDQSPSTQTSTVFILSQSAAASSIMFSNSSIAAEASSVPTPNLGADPLTTSYMSRTTLAASYYAAAETTSQGRRGVDTSDGSGLETTSTPIFASVPTGSSIFITALADSTVITSPSALPISYVETPSPIISTSGVHALVALGTIGTIILFSFIVYAALRVLKIDVLQILKRQRRRQDNNWVYKADPRRDTFSKTLGMYTEKSIPTQRHLDAFYSPIVIPQKVAVPPAKSLVQADSERQELVRETLMRTPPPISKMETVEEHSTKTFYLSQTPARQQSPTLPYSNRISQLSSLSSGFGDAKIDVPESGPTNIKRKSIQGASRSENNNGQGQEFVSRFSWGTTTTDARQLPRQGKRDTVYTTMSVESTPRFRTVASWVNQQSSRIHRQQESDKELESLPKIPAKLAGPRISSHRSIQSEVTDPIFKQHPGDAVEIKPGSRVASFILNKKFGI